MEYEVRPFEERLKQIDVWVESLDRTGEVGYLNREQLTETLTLLGANFLDNGDVDRRRELISLGSHSNKDRAIAMRAVWGDRYGEFVDWTKCFVESYEKDNKELPFIRQKGKKYKNSGMIQFLGRLTAFADGRLSWFDFSSYFEASVQNGKIYIDPAKGEKKKIFITGWVERNGKLIKKTSEKVPASVPPAYVTQAWEKIKSWGV